MGSKSRITVHDEHRGMRLDVFVGLACHMSRSAARALIDTGNVTVDGEQRKPSMRITPGQNVNVTEPDPEPSRLLPEDIPISVLYEDDDIAVINKHAGLVVHPAGPRRTGTLINALLHRWGRLQAPGGPDRPGVVHRLDMGTTGVIIIARNDMSYQDLVRQFQTRSIRKTYRAVVWGIPSPPVKCVDAPMGRHPRHRQKMAVVKTGKEARTTYRVTRSFIVAAELELQLHTGRTHQIRVHLSYLKHPVMGDQTYGGRRKALRRVAPGFRKQCRDLLRVVNRPLLHAETLVFRHPRSGEPSEIHAELPTDYIEAVENLNKFIESHG